MIDKILTALKLEGKALVSDEGKFVGQFMSFGDYKDTGEVTYTFPLVILYTSEARDSEPFCGGAMKIDWNFSLAVYFYDPNSYVDDESGYSEQLALPLDIIRRHFGSTNREWLTPGMPALQKDFAFRMTYDGTVKAPRLKHGDGLAMGFAVLFSTVSVDDHTDSVEQSKYPLQTIENTTTLPTV